MSGSSNSGSEVSGSPLLVAGVLAVLVMAVGRLFQPELQNLLERWEAPEYNHGYMIPLVALYLFWLRAGNLAKLPQGSGMERGGAWLGVAVVAGAVILNVMGKLSAVITISQYALILVIWGLALAASGFRGLRILWVPLLYLGFMVPLPSFLESRLTASLMLLSSEIGVSVIRLAGVRVFLEGNVIDLGTYRLQVAEACSGMRYLFPLMSFGFLCAVLFRGRWWQRAILLLSTVPLTILMNSFRIGVIGVLVNYFGIEQAEGFLHDFEGWVVFMACVGVLFAMIWLFARMEKRPFLEIFGLDVPVPEDLKRLINQATPTKPILTTAALLSVSAVASLMALWPAPVVPERASLASMPLRVGQWSGKERPIDKVYLDALQVSDYLLAEFWRPIDAAPVGLWVAYYDAQTHGVSVHSPQACLPGDGWRISQISDHQVNGAGPDGSALRVNRVDMRLGQERQLVYYWFAQRGRNLTSEYLVKWYIFQDGLTRNRTDGALVRAITPVVPGPTGMMEADARLEAFVRDIDPALAYYLPGEVAVPRAGRASDRTGTVVAR